MSDHPHHPSYPSPTDENLLEEAFAIAARDAADSPRDLLHLRRARRHLVSGWHGVPSLVLADDLWFAAVLIARVLAVDVGFDELDLVALFDAVGLPVEAVPHHGEAAPPRSALDDLAPLHDGASRRDDDDLDDEDD